MATYSGARSSPMGLSRLRPPLLDSYILSELIGPFLFAFVGIFGGLAAFGLVGLFLGPVIMAALLTVWRESAGHAKPAAPGTGLPRGCTARTARALVAARYGGVPPAL